MYYIQYTAPKVHDDLKQAIHVYLNVTAVKYVPYGALHEHAEIFVEEMSIKSISSPFLTSVNPFCLSYGIGPEHISV